MAKSGAAMAAELRKLADWIESDDGQHNAEDKGYVEESWPRAVIAEILHFCHHNDFRADRALFYGWCRFNGETSPYDRYNKFHDALWATLPVIDQDK